MYDYAVYPPRSAAAPQAGTGMPPAGRRLAPHETLEIHELLAYKSTGLVKLKQTYPRIADPELKQLYAQTIRETEDSIRSLLGLFQTYRPYGL